MSTALAVVDVEKAERSAWLCEPVDQTEVMRMLYKVDSLSPFVPNYGEIASAIARASNEDPLFPRRKHGCRLTAAILVACAYRSSGFHPNLVTCMGSRFGLFQIEPPACGLKANLLLIPMSACYVAIDLIRTSVIASKGRDWYMSLAWLLSEHGSPDDAKASQASMDRLLLAEKVCKHTWPGSDLGGSIGGPGGEL